jgi:hypothetical protein
MRFNLFCAPLPLVFGTGLAFLRGQFPIILFEDLHKKIADDRSLMGRWKKRLSGKPSGRRFLFHLQPILKSAPNFLYKWTEKGGAR